MKKKELLKRIEVLDDKIQKLYNRVSDIDNKGVSPLIINEEKKELIIGKWYKYQYLCDGKDDGYLLFNFNGKLSEESQYGFTHTSIGHKFVEDISIYEDEINKYTEATPQEVESALIEEAKRRYKIGDLIKCFDNIESEVKGFDFIFNNNNLFSNGERVNGGDWFNTSAKVFEDGKWAEVIKPEDKPKVGDVVMADYGDDFSIKILKPSDLSSPLFKYTKLTQQEAIDLLFKK